MTHNLATPASADVIRLRALCVELRDWLAAAKHTADDEIRVYPTPIPRCDAQFNYVYEQRARLAQWLARANAAMETDDASSKLESLLAEFAASPPLGAGADELHLRERLRAQLALTSPGSESRER
ncbi:MAG: hypothetical protein ABI569_01680 [Casimicrobiaceae bacterium]